MLIFLSNVIEYDAYSISHVVDDGTCLVLVLLDFFSFGLTLRLRPTKMLILL